MLRQAVAIGSCAASVSSTTRTIAGHVAPSSSRSPVARKSRQTWSANFGARSFQVFTSWKSYRFGRWNGSSSGPPTSWATVNGRLPVARPPARDRIVTVAGSSTGTVAARLRMVSELEARPQLEDRE